MTIVIIALATLFVVSLVLFLMPAKQPVVAVYAINQDYVATTYHCHTCGCRHSGACDA